MEEEKQESKLKKEKESLLKRLNKTYHFLMSHDETREPIMDFRLNLMRLILVVIGIALLLIIITTFIIAFTPLREYIPGYADTKLNREVYNLNRRADSLIVEMQKRDNYFYNLQKVIGGYDFAADSCNEELNIYAPLPKEVLDTIMLKKSVQDSLLRMEFENESQYDLFALPVAVSRNTEVKNFYVPLSGTILQPFNAANGHYGVDIVAEKNQIINATLDGTVVFSTWSIDNGYTIGIQHDDSYFSTYKHNATLLKKEGDFVKAGEAIAILGESGESGEAGKSKDVPHLHFEIWYNGMALNPENYMNFKSDY